MNQVIKANTCQGVQIQAATVVTNRRALRHNLQHPRELAPASKVAVAVKANTYGHGLLKTARTLPGVDISSVARLEEALRLRAGGITRPVLLLEGSSDARNLPTTSAQHPHTTVHNEEQPTALEKASLDEPAVVWVKLNTGMHRLGVRPERAKAFYHRLTRCKGVRQPMNIVSHFTCADEPRCGATEKQLAIFNAFCEDRPGQRSIVVSSDILLWPQSHFNWMHPGITLYGVSPLEDRSTGADFGHQPVMSLISSLIVAREHRAGEPVGYSGAWVSERDARLGVVAMGCGDGYPRATPSGIPVLVNGREVPIVGHVVMDTIYTDLGPQMRDKTGGPVVLWGEGLSVERIAEMARVSAYGLITCLTLRVAVEYVD